MSSPLLVRSSISQPVNGKHRATMPRELESIAQLVEDMIPNFKKEEERQFYREVVQAIESRRVTFCETLRLANKGCVQPCRFAGKVGRMKSSLLHRKQLNRN